MKPFLTFILAVALLAAPAVHAQSTCEASDPSRLAAVMTGTAVGHAIFSVDRNGGQLFYRVDASRLADVTGASIQRAGVDVLDLVANDQLFVDGVLEGVISPSRSILEELYANPAAFSIRVTSESGSMRGQLNGRGTVLMSGSLAMAAGSSAKVKPDVASNAMGVFSVGFVDDDPAAGDVRVDFDVLTDSIDGMDTASLVLVDGDATTDVLDLVTAEGLVNGRLHGSVRLRRQELERIVENPGGYQLQFRSPNDGLFSGELTEAVTTFIPAFGRSRNASGHQFSSDLRLHNPGPKPANVFIQFYPAGATKPLAGSTAVVRLEPNQSRVISDAVTTLFGSAAGMGSLRIVTSAQVIADSEIVESAPPSASRIQTNSHNPRMGQFIGGIGNCDAVTHGVLTSLAASNADGGLRTNILLGNPGVRPAFAHFELRDALGRLLDSTSMNIPAHAQMLMPLAGAHGLFHRAAGELGNVTLTMYADTPLFLGSSLIQNGTGLSRFDAARDVAPKLK